MSPHEPLTRLQIEYVEGRHNYRRLFGQPVRTHTIEDRPGGTVAVEMYRPGQLFALDLWDRNDYGTIRWHVYVLQAAALGQLARRVPQVDPGAIVLLEAFGVRQCKVVVAWLADLEAAGDPAEHPPAFFEARDFLLKGVPPRRLTPELLHRNSR